MTRPSEVHILLDFYTSAASRAQDSFQGGRQRAVLVHLSFTKHSTPEALEEFKELAASSGVEAVALVSGVCKKANAKYLIGIGKVEEISVQVNLHKADVVLFDHILTPSQERNLEAFLKCRVLDRTGLILDIFAARARTFEGRLQVELAQLQYLSTRLVRGWTHLERQRGGIGLRGPGETQLELDKRLIANRIRAIRQQLGKVRSQRAQGRRSRKRANIPVISLVGYTNAGKSTLFNRLTESEVYVADQLFATLDPTLRRLDLPNIGPVILVDTVGFIRALPHQLVEAFHATLEETKEADLLLHVIDASNPERLDFIQAVDEVLKEIHAEEIPQLRIYNKLDLMPGKEPSIKRNEWGEIQEVWVSAATNSGIDLLKQALLEFFGKEMVTVELRLTSEQSKLRAELYERGVVVKESMDESGGWTIQARMNPVDYGRLRKLGFPEDLD